MVSLECQPALKIIAQYGQHPDCLLYVDPPYLGSSRCAQARYPHEMANVAQHAELASALTTCNAMVAISGYQTSLYEQLYADWSCTKIATSTEQGGYGSPRQEMVWLKS
jgi:DNA adenine methylase